MQDVTPEDSLEAPRKAQIYEGGSMSCKRRHVHTVSPPEPEISYTGAPCTA